MVRRKTQNGETQLSIGSGEAPVASSRHDLLIPSDAAQNGIEPADLSKSTKEQRQEFFLQVNGFVWLYPEEVQVADHPTFQRLGRIYQLGQTGSCIEEQHTNDSSMCWVLFRWYSE